jgi:YidC/Oxa1 family membrane protein insertase
MDRNQIIGFVLILLMLVGYQLLIPAPEPPKEVPKPKVATQATATTPALDTAAAKAQLGDFAAIATGTAKDIVIENADMRLTLSTLGGKIKEVLLKKYKTYTGTPLILLDEKSSNFNIELPTNKGNVNLQKLYFTTTSANQTLKEGQSTTIVFEAALAPNQVVQQVYTIGGSGYSIDYDIKLNGLDGVLKNEAVKLTWENRLKQFENDLSENRKVVTTNYYSDGESDDIGVGQQENVEEKLEKGAQWFTHKNKYFLSGLIAKNGEFTNLNLKSQVNLEDSSYVKTMITEASLPIADLKTGKGSYQFYLGPNDYQIVKEIKATDFGDNVDLGYAFLKPINKYFFVPMFSFLEKYFSNYGILIIVLVVLVKLAMTPLVYKSYVSMAKMRVLAPELAIIKEKIGDDQVKMQQEQMKLYQQVGVSPLSGCVPVLATMPILMSLFFLFPNLIELRQQSFLWANDLSTYDAPIRLPFSIPFYGAHVSIFTLLMTISQVIYAWYNNQITPVQPNQPIDMRTLTYIMPVMFMFIMNTFPAGLSFYYFISNIATIIQQQIIKRFVDDDKLKAALEENRKKIASGVKKKSKFSEMLEKSMKAAEEAKKNAEETQKRIDSKKKK